MAARLEQRKQSERRLTDLTQLVRGMSNGAGTLSQGLIQANLTEGAGRS
jgi:hypothetical protein